MTRGDLKRLIREAIDEVLSEEDKEEETLEEMTCTGNVAGYNLPANVQSRNWVSSKGGSKRGIDGSPTGMTLTSIGAQDLKRPQDRVY